MSWLVEFHEDYLAELSRESSAVRKAVVAAAINLEHSGPLLGRPHADTLKGSNFPNMKELRISVADGEWRIAYAFDPKRQAILLTGASKSGISQQDFYRRLIRIADQRYTGHLAKLIKEKKT